MAEPRERQPPRARWTRETISQSSAPSTFDDYSRCQSARPRGFELKAVQIEEVAPRGGFFFLLSLEAASPELTRCVLKTTRARARGDVHARSHVCALRTPHPSSFSVVLREAHGEAAREVQEDGRGQRGRQEHRGEVADERSRCREARAVRAFTSTRRLSRREGRIRRLAPRSLSPAGAAEDQEKQERRVAREGDRRRDEEEQDEVRGAACPGAAGQSRVLAGGCWGSRPRFGEDGPWSSPLGRPREEHSEIRQGATAWSRPRGRFSRPMGSPRPERILRIADVSRCRRCGRGE